MAAVLVLTPSMIRAQAPGPVTAINASPKVYSLNVCEKRQFSASASDAEGMGVKDAKIVWKSTNPEVATVDNEGVVMGVSPGYTFLWAISGKVKSNPISLFIRDKGVDRGC